MKNTRRDFLKTMGLGASVMAAAAHPLAPSAFADKPGPERPNILWISAEDISPDLGCYGEPYNVTPNLDRLAAEGVRYTRAFTSAGVCGPVRSGVITGMHAVSIGTHQMRCKGVPPPEVKCFTEQLRAAGYYCSNRSKTDYQFASPVTAWDNSSPEAHWRGRAEGQPFFSVINLESTHESKIRSKDWETRTLRHDPAKAPIPPYYPDTPVVRQDWARYCDNITEMDKSVGEILRDLKDDGLEESTIVWFWGDHGRGLPRAKRWVYDSGIHIPLLIRVPEKYRKLASLAAPTALNPGTVQEELVSSIDFGPTVLSVAGLKAPSHIQGRAFLGAEKKEPREHIFASHDRMGEAYETIRGVRDKRFKYIRNFMPQISRAQDNDYLNQMPTMREMRRLNAEGKLTGPQKQFFEPKKPIEELYDTTADPHEIVNLAADPKMAGVLASMRKTLLDWMREVGDVGLVPEPDFDAMKRPFGEFELTADPVLFSSDASLPDQPQILEIHCSTLGASIAFRTDGKQEGPGWHLYAGPIELNSGQTVLAKACRLGFTDSKVIRHSAGEALSTTAPPPPQARRLHWRDRINESGLLDRLLALKALDGQGTKAVPAYIEALKDPAGSLRYWAAIGLQNESRSLLALKKGLPALLDHILDPSPSARVATAQTLCDWGMEKRALPVLIDALFVGEEKSRLFAAIALGRIGEKARPAIGFLQAAMQAPYPYIPQVTKYTLARLEKNR